MKVKPPGGEASYPPLTLFADSGRSDSGRSDSGRLQHHKRAARGTGGGRPLLSPPTPHRPTPPPSKDFRLRLCTDHLRGTHTSRTLRHCNCHMRGAAKGKQKGGRNAPPAQSPTTPPSPPRPPIKIHCASEAIIIVHDSIPDCAAGVPRAYGSSRTRAWIVSSPPRRRRHLTRHATSTGAATSRMGP